LENNFLKQTKNKLEKTENEVIPMIPDLEEIVDQEFKEQTAQAPNVQINKLISFQDLDKNMLKHSAYTSFDGIDLTPLTLFCLPESKVKEDDVTWNWDNLMSDVTSKLMPDSDSNYNQ
jgi:intraflagellar transport protein 43